MNYTASKVKLKKAALDSLLSEFHSDTQSHKIVRYLAKNSSVPVKTLRTATGAANIPQVVRSAINPRLFQLGYQVACERKPCARYFVWSLYELGEIRNAG